MLELIPKELRPDLSPLLVQAATWPDARALTRIPTKLAEGEPAPDPTERAALEGTLSLVHPALTGVRTRLYRTAEGGLFARLDGPADAPADDPRKGWSGWASWAPCAEPVRAFALYAKAAAPRGDASAEVLTALLGDLLAPDLAAEVAAGRPHPAPAATGPEHFVATYRLDPAGYGMAYGHVYGYTNGQRVVAAIQPLVHRAL